MDLVTLPDESARERADRHAAERAAVHQNAMPWRMALGLLFGLYVLWHFWLWNQRGIRPRVSGLDSQLTFTRWVNAGAVFWVICAVPATMLFGTLRRLFLGLIAHKRTAKDEAVGSDVPRSTRLSFWENASWVIPCLTSALFLTYYLAGAAIVVSMVALLVLPWAPVVYLIRRAFPDGGRELVVAGLLLFFAVGVAQSFANRDFYTWKFRNKGVHFVVPHEPASRP